MRRRLLLLVCLCFVIFPIVPRVAHAEDSSQAHTQVPQVGTWVWPLARFSIAREFQAPEHPYGPGHRGIDLAPRNGKTVLSPARGVVAFSGMVAGRGVLTIDHGSGLISTLEPVNTTVLVGDHVDRGQELATISQGGHTPAGQLYFGVRWNGQYINPRLILGGLAAAVLLPCCANGG